ncbi:DUF4427 domain-containing protein [Ralstonia chuxiongensis]|uniref:DUF4427 domain-containing protein n=1 Tax=Ralstonia chuxiongensis TaxID=2957504 RepID=UPI0028F55723|nr:DUF4427 domain-containing protein [Ralstonia chuxiongensis]CAJ0784739.1 hypothetical protein R8510_05296 [Ralstonia chuxiongensis]
MKNDKRAKLRNSIRFDLSDYLIHFFRDVDMMGRNAIVMPENMGWHSLAEDTFYPAIFMLRAAIRNGRLWATWSYRKEARTIYGPSPAVCFTDMPIAAFVEASRERHARGEAMGEVALVFPKAKMRTLGARSAIYGLSKDPTVWPGGQGGGPRVFPADVLPLQEQYRYITDAYPIDWSHEREWRWPCRVKYPDWEGDSVANWFDIPGLDFYDTQISGIGAIVKTRAQAESVIQDMLTLVDAGMADPYAFSFVLPTDELPSPEAIRDRNALKDALAKATIDINKYFEVSEAEVAEVNRQFTDAVWTIENGAPHPQAGEVGECWLWLHDGSSRLARMLLADGRLSVSRNGRYLARLAEFSDSRSLREREAMTERLAAAIQKKFGVSCGYFSVLNSSNPDDVPFYAQDHDENIPYYNATWLDR